MPKDVHLYYDSGKKNFCDSNMPKFTDPKHELLFTKDNSKFNCGFCDKKVAITHKNKHLKSARCVMFQNAINAIKQSLHEHNKAETFNDIMRDPYLSPDRQIVYLTIHQYNYYKKLESGKYNYVPLKK
jgi:glutaredoxin-related protein